MDSFSLKVDYLFSYARGADRDALHREKGDFSEDIEALHDLGITDTQIKDIDELISSGIF